MARTYNVVDFSALRALGLKGEGDIAVAAKRDSSDNVAIGDLTINCGFDQSDQKAARQAIVLQGANCVVDRVNVVNYTAAEGE